MNEIVKTPYMRPNLENQGEVPPTGEVICSPDICFAGMHPIADFQTTLKQTESYSQIIEEVATCEVNNYVYLRCRNGAEKAVSIQAQLYIVPKTKCIFPEEWIPLSVDNREEAEGNTTNIIPLMQPGEIGVAEAPFIWKKPSSDNLNDYCLMARLFSDEFPNDKPQASSVLKPTYMIEFLQDGLLWAQHNISKLEFNPNKPFWSKDINLNIPTDTSLKNHNCLISIESSKFEKWDIQIQASRTDEEGKEIYMERRPVESEFILGHYIMSPGFFTRMSFLLYPRTTDITVDNDAYITVGIYNKVSASVEIPDMNSAIQHIKVICADDINKIKTE